MVSCARSAHRLYVERKAREERGRQLLVLVDDEQARMEREARKETIHSVERSNETLDEKESKLIKEEKTNDENCEVAKRMLENASRNFKVAVEKGDMLGVRLAGECYKVPGTNLHWLPSIELQPERRDQIW